MGSVGGVGLIPFVVVDDEVPPVEAVCASVGDDVAGFPRFVGSGIAEQVGRPAAVHTDDGVGNVHGLECGTTFATVSGTQRHTGTAMACA